MFEGLGLLTSAEFDGAYEAAKDFTAALRKRVTIGRVHGDPGPAADLLELRQRPLHREETPREAAACRR